MSEESTRIRAGTITCEKTRKLKILKSLHKLIHACKCTDLNCEEIGCDEMKSLVVHFKVCTKKRKRTECTLCRQLLALCHYHAKNSKDCETIHCVVPYCAKIKFKLDSKTGARPQKAQLWEPEPNVFAATSSTSGTTSDADLGQSSNSESHNYVFNVEPLPEPPDEVEAATNSGDEDEFLEQLEEDLADLLDLEFPPPVASNPQDDQYLSIPQIPDPQGDTARSSMPPNLYNQRLLEKLLHSQNCLTGEEAGVARWPCFETDCGIMKNVIRHISQCQLGGECTRIHCSLAKGLLTHWRSCEGRECGLCKPLRLSSRMGTFGAHSLPPVNPPRSNWKDNVFSITRREIVEYATAILVARCTDYTHALEAFVKKIEDYAFHTSTSSIDYCLFISGRLPFFDTDSAVARLRQGYEVPEYDVMRLFETVLSPNTPCKQQQILEFLKAHPPFMQAFVERRAARMNAIRRRFE